jgi:hypothetical protein
VSIRVWPIPHTILLHAPARGAKLDAFRRIFARDDLAGCISMLTTFAQPTMLTIVTGYALRVSDDEHDDRAAFEREFRSVWNGE